MSERETNHQKAAKKKRSAIGVSAMEIIIFLIAGGSTVWIVCRVQKANRAREKAILDNASRIVLGDPDYVDRRRCEERKQDQLAAYYSR